MAIKDMQTVPSVKVNTDTKEMLKPCPFCGRPAMIMKKVDTICGDKYIAQCSDTTCNGRIYRTYPTEEQAKKAWNRRM